MAACVENDNDMKLLGRTIDSVIRSKHADLKQALKGTMPKFADEMLAADLITDGVMESRDFETIVSDFLAGLKFTNDLSKLVRQWNTFIHILENLGGPSKRAAQQLNDMLSEKSDHFKVEKDQKTFDGSSNNRKDSISVANAGVAEIMDKICNIPELSVVCDELKIDFFDLWIDIKRSLHSNVDLHEAKDLLHMSIVENLSGKPDLLEMSLKQLDSVCNMEDFCKFLISNLFISYLNYGLLRQLVQLCHNQDLQTKLKGYEQKYRKFLRATLFNDVFNEYTDVKPTAAIGLPLKVLQHERPDLFRSSLDLNWVFEAADETDSSDINTDGSLTPTMISELQLLKDIDDITLQNLLEERVIEKLLCPVFKNEEGATVNKEVIITRDQKESLEQNVLMIPATEIDKIVTALNCEEIGKGGFGTVYKGIYRHAEVAVKLLNEEGRKALLNKTKSKDIVTNELQILTRYRHPNLLPLMGYCAEKSALIFPYMSCQSLFINIHHLKTLTWSQRKSILVDTAKGLAYLHAESPPLVHQDIKSSNVLLDQHYQAKVCDFGFTVQMPCQVGNTTLINMTSSCMVGTKGYFPPEYMDGKYGPKGDVYAYGILTLETYTGQLAYSENRDDARLADYYEDQLEDLESFCSIAITDTESCTEETAKCFWKVVSSSLKRYKLRSSIEEVLQLWQKENK